MPPETQGPDDPSLWMEFARTDLRMAEEGVQYGYRLEPLCYHAQQAAEKALKALFISRRLPYPKTHDLEKLIALLPPGLSAPPQVRKAVEISDYSEKGRYPHGFEDLTPKDYQKAVALAKAVVDWAGKVLAGEGPSGAREKPAVYGAAVRRPSRPKLKLKRKK